VLRQTLSFPSFCPNRLAGRKELWVERMSTSMNANPMSYAGRSGKQYVAGVVGGAVVVWALP